MPCPPPPFARDPVIIFYCCFLNFTRGLLKLCSFDGAERRVWRTSETEKGKNQERQGESFKGRIMGLLYSCQIKILKSGHKVEDDH